MISFVLIFTSMFSVAAEYQKDENIDTLSPRYAIPMSMNIGLNFNSDNPYVSTAIVDISAHPDDVDYFILRVVLEKYSSSGYTVVNTWRDVKTTVDSGGFAHFTRKYTHDAHGSYRIRVSGEGYKNSKSVVTFSDKVSNIANC